MTSKKQATLDSVIEEETTVIEESENSGSELVVAPGNELVSAGDMITDPDLFLQAQEDEDEDNIDSLPRLRIDQKSKDNAGKLICEDMAQSWDTMNLVLLRKSASRILWPETFKKDNKALCKSHDGKVPQLEDKDNDTYEPKATSCDKCPLSKWTTVDGQRIPPRCSEVTDLLVVDTEMMVPFFYSVYAVALSIYNKTLKKPLKLRTMSLSAKRKQVGKSPAHSCMFSFNLSTYLDERDSGNSYQPVFSDIKELSDGEKDMFVQVAIGCQMFSPHSRPVEQDDFGGDGSDNGVQDEAFTEREEF